VKSAHDCSEGGFAVALAESCISRQIARDTPRLIGAKVDLSKFESTRRDALLFGETQGRIIISVSRPNLESTLAECARLGIPAAHIGAVGGADLAITSRFGKCDWDLGELHDLWWNAIARQMKV
jgi:phosphoribosylformylglycinamidine synthase subunit PurL